MNVTTSLESIQEQRVTPMVENGNQQQIYIYGSESIFYFHLVEDIIQTGSFVNQLNK